MKKHIFAISAVILFFGTVTFAATEVSKTTKEVLGFSNLLNTDATSCDYSVEKQKDGKGAVVVSLRSDKETGIQDSIRIAAAQLPLKEGVLMARPGLSITYRDGVLTKKEKLAAMGPDGQDYQVLMLKVSPDLKDISLGYALDSVKTIFKEKVLAEMNCKF